MARHTTRLARSRQSLTDPRHLVRFLKSQAGASPEIIAKEERVGLTTIKDSIRMVDTYRKQNTAEEMNFAVRDILISSAPRVKATLHRLLDATELVERKNVQTGTVEIVEQDDKTTQLEALRISNSMIQNLQPKVPLIEQNISQTNQTAMVSGTESNEDRFRRLMEQAKKHNELPPEVAGVPRYLDAGEDAPDDDDNEDDEGDEDE